jgi:GT2 family glycosyltransferase
VRTRFPWAELIELPRNVGFAAGNNAGLRRARGRHCAQLTNDTIVLPGALERCVAYLDDNPSVGVVGPQLLDPDGSKQNSVHSVPNLVSEIVPKAVLETIAPWRYPSKRYEHPGPVVVEAVLGACLVLRRTLLDEVGLMPEDYFMFLEETDWCWRIRRAGYKVVHLPDARVIHVHGATSKKRLPAETRIEYDRSLYRFLEKNRGESVARTVRGLRVAKGMLRVATGALAAPFSRRRRERWGQDLRVLAWHLRGRPAGAGLAPLPAGEGAR